MILDKQNVTLFISILMQVYFISYFLYLKISKKRENISKKIYKLCLVLWLIAASISLISLFVF